MNKMFQIENYFEIKNNACNYILLVV